MWHSIHFIIQGLLTSWVFFFVYLFVCLFVFAALGLHCCMKVLSSCGERGLLFTVVCKLLVALGSLVPEHSSCGARAQ